MSLSGKKGLIVGIANGDSIAFGCAEAFRAAGAELAVTYLNAKADPYVLLLTGDHGYALFDDFRRELPFQYINAGIAEQNMIGMAAGLALSVRSIGADVTCTVSNSIKTAEMLSCPPAAFAASISCVTASSSDWGALDNLANVSSSSSFDNPSLHNNNLSPGWAWIDTTSMAMVSSTPTARVN